MLIERKRAKTKENEIMEIPLPSGKYGYCKVIRKDDFAALLEIYEDKYSEQQAFEDWKSKKHKVKEIAYVNDYTARKRWKHMGFIENDPKQKHKIPIMFYGTSMDGWTIVKDGKEEYLRGDKISYDSLKKRGYMDKVLWLAKTIENAIDDEKELIWPGLK